MAQSKPVIKKALERHKGSTIDTGKGLTEQAHKKETDMNYILKEYARTGFIRHAKENKGRYDDITVTDFQEAMFKVTEAQNMFNELPAKVRQRFGNDPAAFLGFVQDPANTQEMHRLGILQGNDGIDVSGTAVNVPTQAHYEDSKAKTPVEPPAT
jgi:phage internal scaffolding protein